MTAIEIVVALSGSALAGGLINQTCAILFGRRKGNLDEASIIQSIYSKLNDDLEERDKMHEEKITKLRAVIISLTDILNEVLPKLDGITADEKRRLNAASIEARLTGLAA